MGFMSYGNLIKISWVSWDLSNEILSNPMGILSNRMGFMGFIFHFRSCVSYTIATQTGFRGSSFFLAAWLIMLVRRDLPSLQEPCFHWV